jgi:hypothetical protein
LARKPSQGHGQMRASLGLLPLRQGKSKDGTAASAAMAASTRRSKHIARNLIADTNAVDLVRWKPNDEKTSYLNQSLMAHRGGTLPTKDERQRMLEHGDATSDRGFGAIQI